MSTRKTDESWEITYSGDWKKFKRLNKLFWFLFITMFAWPPLGATILSSIPMMNPPEHYMHPLTHSRFSKIIFWCFFFSIPLSFITWIGVGLFVDRWKCPRCHERFSRSNFGSIYRLIFGYGRTGIPAVYLMGLLQRINHALGGAKGLKRAENNSLATTLCANCGLAKHPDK